MPTDPTVTTTESDPEDQIPAPVAIGNSAAVILIPVASGRVAIFRSNYSLHSITDEPPDSVELKRLSEEFYLTIRQRQMTAETFYGEPGDRALARDLKTGRTPERIPRSKAAVPLDVEI